MILEGGGASHRRKAARASTRRRGRTASGPPSGRSPGSWPMSLLVAVCPGHWQKEFIRDPVSRACRRGPATYAVPGPDLSLEPQCPICGRWMRARFRCLASGGLDEPDGEIAGVQAGRRRRIKWSGTPSESAGCAGGALLPPAEIRTGLPQQGPVMPRGPRRRCPNASASPATVDATARASAAGRRAGKDRHARRDRRTGNIGPIRNLGASSLCRAADPPGRPAGSGLTHVPAFDPARTPASARITVQGAGRDMGGPPSRARVRDAPCGARPAVRAGG